jgi:hypothetical protein
MKHSDVALIFSNRDIEKAKILEKYLKMEDISVWQSQMLLPGESFEKQIILYHSACKVIIFLASQKAQSAGWLQSEVTPWAKLCRRDRDPMLLTIMLEQFEIPQPLKNIEFLQWIDASNQDFSSVCTATVSTVSKWVSEPRFFVCHSHLDHKEVTQLTNELKVINRDIQFWFDSDPVPTGVDIVAGIKAGISRANYLLLCLSKNLIKGLHHTHNEGYPNYLQIEFFEAKEREKRRRSRKHFFTLTVVLKNDVETTEPGLNGLLNHKSLVKLYQNHENGINRINELLSEPVP